jgi:hypothetical protein
VTQFRTRPNAPSWSSSVAAPCPPARGAVRRRVGAAVTVRRMAHSRGRSARDYGAPDSRAGAQACRRYPGAGQLSPAQARYCRAPRCPPPQGTSLPSCSGTRILAGYPVVTNYCNILFDVLVHAQDIAIPLGRDYPMPPEAARAGADRVWTMGWPFCARPDSAGSGCSPPISTGPLAAPNCGDRSGCFGCGSGAEGATSENSVRGAA